MSHLSSAWQRGVDDPLSVVVSSPPPTSPPTAFKAPPVMLKLCAIHNQLVRISLLLLLPYIFTNSDIAAKPYEPLSNIYANY